MLAFLFATLRGQHIIRRAAGRLVADLAGCVDKLAEGLLRKGARDSRAVCADGLLRGY